MVSIFLFFEILVTFLMMIGLSYFGARQHNKIHEKIENHITYKVIREGQVNEIKLNDLCVGDVIVPKKG